jgi:anthranilate synthase component 2
MILLIDNYDSFTYNLYQYIGEINNDIKVVRNDKITIEEIELLNPSHIVISPGPGFPVSAGITIPLIRALGKKIPILGVCLGHQAIGEAYGGKVIHAKQLMHGKASEIIVNSQSKIFEGLEDKITAARYHSLIVESGSLPECLEITASSHDGEIMGLKHKKFNVFGIQFHPESIMTPDGKKILNNFLKVGKNSC